MLMKLLYAISSTAPWITLIAKKPKAKYDAIFSVKDTYLIEGSFVISATVCTVYVLCIVN